MASPNPNLAEKRRILQLETLYDLAVTLHAHRQEQELVEELLERVCAVLDPASAVAVTRGAYGGIRAVATVGWPAREPEGVELFSDPVWQELLTSGRSLARHGGELAGCRFDHLLTAPISYRGVFLGYIALLDKELRAGEISEFSEEDRRFLESVVSLVGVTLDSARQVEDLEAQRERLEEENKLFKDRFAAEVEGRRIIAHAEPMRRVLEKVERVAPRGVSVLVRGESGTGKELVAKLLHHLSDRAGPLVALSCAAIPETLLESELFGIEKGVATGVQARRGKFELAHGGTLFLDEIGDMAPSLQVKLLRAIQEREIVRVGGHESIPVDVRLVAATHRDLQSMVAAGTFREDLFYRLRGIEITLPALRERRQDIPYFVRLFAEEFARREKVPPPQFRAEALALLLDYEFPGNVRELQNLVEGAGALSEGAIDADLIASLIGASGRRSMPEALDLETVERRHISRVLEIADGNKSRAARILGVNRRTLQRKGF